jgi:hypothetical protein
MYDYTLVDEDGNIVLSRFTTDPNYPPGEGQRIVYDVNPSYDRDTQYLERVVPVSPTSNSVTYIVRDIVYTDEQISDSVKIRRLELLLETDYTQLLDSPVSEEKKSEFAVYRQELRDITTQSGYPRAVTWPTKPE